MADRMCRFIANRARNSKAARSSQDVFDSLVLPAMAHFPQFSTAKLEYDAGEIVFTSEYAFEDIELVIADLTEMPPSGFFRLGGWYSLGRPIIVIGAEEMKLAVTTSGDMRLIRYPKDPPGPSGDDKLATAQPDLCH
ncbi:hypothetical protein [Bradyrhizobium yuanmingense]|uniref:hypothetical protein n=1 Tax=Bradyrhizobium yuanmingense TaxID=108015 RepID=UPI001CD228B1|nr:hypothetical protein [Bradyrhizobium yuanmingense]MCA1530417.1 hypothetical protein [Bradyrhizobium yuanmingense]